MDITGIFPNGLSIDDGYDLLAQVAVYILGMTAYALFVFKFYRSVAARDMFALDLSRYEESRFKWVRSFLQVVMYVAKYIILFPIFAFFWFAVLTLILVFLSKDRSFTDVLQMALITVGAIRVTAYYNEDLSRDLAKILPFAVLGIFLVNASFFELPGSLGVLEEAWDYPENIFYYLVFLIALEFVLRLAMAVVAFLVATNARLFRRSEPVTQSTAPAEESAPAEGSAAEQELDSSPVPDDEGAS